MEFPRLQHPFTMILAGPTHSGKTYFLKNLIHFKKEMFFPVPDKIVYFYGIYQPLYDEMEGVTFVEGFPSNFRDFLGINTLFLLDDLMVECANDKQLTNLFTKGSHHLNLSIVFITQNFFHKGKEMRDVTLNAHYLVLFKNRRDLSQVTHLGRQLYPRHINFFQEVYEDATKQPYSYLLVDLKSECPEQLRLRTQILPNETQYVYQLKKI